MRVGRGDLLFVVDGFKLGVAVLIQELRGKLGRLRDILAVAEDDDDRVALVENHGADVLHVGFHNGEFLVAHLADLIEVVEEILIGERLGIAAVGGIKRIREFLSDQDAVAFRDKRIIRSGHRGVIAEVFVSAEVRVEEDLARHVKAVFKRFAEGVPFDGEDRVVSAVVVFEGVGAHAHVVSHGGLRGRQVGFGVFLGAEGAEFARHEAVSGQHLIRNGRGVGDDIDVNQVGVQLTGDETRAVKGGLGHFSGGIFFRQGVDGQNIHGRIHGDLGVGGLPFVEFLGLGDQFVDLVFGHRGLLVGELLLQRGVLLFLQARNRHGDSHSGDLDVGEPFLQLRVDGLFGDDFADVSVEMIGGLPSFLIAVQLAPVIGDDNAVVEIEVRAVLTDQGGELVADDEGLQDLLVGTVREQIGNRLVDDTLEGVGVFGVDIDRDEGDDVGGQEVMIGDSVAGGRHAFFHQAAERGGAVAEVAAQVVAHHDVVHRAAGDLEGIVDDAGVLGGSAVLDRVFKGLGDEAFFGFGGLVIHDLNVALLVLGEEVAVDLGEEVRQVDIAGQDGHGVGRMIIGLMEVLNVFEGHIRNVFGIAAGDNRAVAAVVEHSDQVIAGPALDVERAEHFTVDDTAEGDLGISVFELIAVSFAHHGVLVFHDERVENAVHVVVKIDLQLLFGSGGHRVRSDSLIGAGVQIKVAGLVHHFEEQVGAGVFLGTAQGGVFEDMREARVVVNRGAESNAVGTVSAVIGEPNQRGTGLLVFERHGGGIHGFHLVDVGHDETVDFSPDFGDRVLGRGARVDGKDRHQDREKYKHSSQFFHQIYPFMGSFLNPYKTLRNYKADSFRFR